jgi:hypothetical protein
MKFFPTKIIHLFIFIFALLLTPSCSKDSDLLSDYVLSDPEISIDNPETKDEEGFIVKTASFLPINDAYIQDVNGFNQTVMKLRENLRTSYLMFDLDEVVGNITDVSLEFTVVNDPGDGIIDVYKGTNNDWTEEQLTSENAPSKDLILGTVNETYLIEKTVIIDLIASDVQSEKTTIVMVHSLGNDLAIASKENDPNLRPKLNVTYRAPPGTKDIVQEEEVPVPDSDPVDRVDSACFLGSSCATMMSNCFDSNYPIIQEFVLAGVTGGIPNNLQIAKTVSPSDNLQSVINSVSSGGGGVILLTAGTYPISTTLNMKSNVVLRGVSKDEVIIESTVKGTDSNAYSIYFDGVSGAGIENITHFYRVDGCDIIDKETLNNGDYDRQIYSNDPCGITNIVVGAIGMSKTTSNSWVDNCNILESGSHAIRLRGNNCTVSRSYIDRSYNKGPGGRGYFDITGNYNLVVGNTVKRIRHLAIQLGARYNVVYNNLLWVDVNFHDDDAGENLIEQNTITTPSWHAWNTISTGATEYHRPPGPNNIIYNNTTNHRQTGENLFGEEGVIYTVKGFNRVEELGKVVPQCNTFYPFRIN